MHAVPMSACYCQQCNNQQEPVSKGLPAKVTELATVGLSVLPSMLGLRGGAEALSEACSDEGCSHLGSEVQLGILSCGSELVCKLAWKEMAGTLMVACKRLLLMLCRLASLSGPVLAGCKSSLLTSNSPKISPSSSPDHDMQTSVPS